MSPIAGRSRSAAPPCLQQRPERARRASPSRGMIAPPSGPIPPDAPALSHEAADHADRTDDAALKVIVCYGLGSLRVVCGPFLESVRYADEGIELCRNDSLLGADLLGMPAYAPLANFRGIALAAIGRLDEAAKQADSLIEFSSKQGLLRGVSTGHIIHAVRCE